MKKYLPNFEKGFTLIELMVVVTIIAFLSVIGIVAFSNAQAQARDGRRRADIDAIATAMESNRNLAAGTYHAFDTSIFANSTFPCDPLDQTSSTCLSNVTSTSVSPSAGAAGAVTTTAGRALLPFGTVVAASGYGYQIRTYATSSSTDPVSFFACARLEKGNGNANAIPASEPTTTATQYTFTTGTTYYCRVSQQ